MTIFEIATMVGAAALGACAALMVRRKLVPTILKAVKAAQCFVCQAEGMQVIGEGSSESTGNLAVLLQCQRCNSQYLVEMNDLGIPITAAYAVKSEIEP